jgi:hypothetical protein
MPHIFPNLLGEFLEFLSGISDPSKSSDSCPFFVHTLIITNSLYFLKEKENGAQIPHRSVKRRVAAQRHAATTIYVAGGLRSNNPPTPLEQPPGPLY